MVQESRFKPFTAAAQVLCLNSANYAEGFRTGGAPLAEAQSADERPTFSSDS